MAGFVSSGGVVLNSEGQVAVVYCGRNSYFLLRCNVRGEEDSMLAARRKIAEEIGLDIGRLRVVDYLGDYQMEGEKVIHVYLFRFPGGKLNPRGSNRAEWVDVEEVADRLTKGDREVFRNIASRLVSVN